MGISGELLSLWEHTNKTNVSMTLHLCEWKYVLPCDNHVLPNNVVKILPSFWKPDSIIVGAIFAIYFHLCNTGKGIEFGMVQ